MKKNLTELIFILDRSGSMCGLESDTIGGFNALLQKQRDQPGEALITTVLFDHAYELLHDRQDIRGVAPLTAHDYTVRGTTALLDAMGRTIDKIATAHKNMLDDHRPEKTLFVITTDGLENASREYRADAVRALVKRQQDEAGWTFLFLGANIDAVQAARGLGIRESGAANYCPDGAGTRLNYQAVGDAVSRVRQSQPLTAAWKRAIADDYRRRKA